jgi:hypothetical protein
MASSKEARDTCGSRRYPRRFQLPITLGFVRRDEFVRDISPRMAKDLGKTRLSDKEIDVVLHAIAFMNASIIVERTMRMISPKEVALIIAEDRDRVKTQIKEMQRFLQNPKRVAHLQKDEDCLPLTRIRDTVHFAKKQESVALQLADMCAFVIRGYLSGHPMNKPFYEAIHPLMLVHPKDD